MSQQPVIKPDVLHESSMGIQLVPITDELLSRREVMLDREIDGGFASSLCSQLIYLAREDPDKEITVWVDSPGGSVASGLAVYDVMRLISCPIRTVCMGTAASMAAVLFAAGNTRLMMPHSRVMIHDPRIPSTGGTALELDAIAQDIMRTRQAMASILAEHTGKTVDEILEKTKSDTFFSAEEAIEFGLADSVMEGV